MIIKFGSKGDSVMKIQKFLKVKETGEFGPLTEKAVIAWQKANGLKPDGVVGDLTWAKMFKPEPLTQIGLKLDKLVGHVQSTVLDQLPGVIQKYNINTPVRLAHFLSQASHESGGFSKVYENLNYSAKGLKATFRKDFPGTLNESYAGKPIAIANRAYALQNGNGPESSGDGYKYRGRGYIQLTGKGNYLEFDKTVDDDILNNPDLVATKYPLESAAFFFNANKIWAICDKGADQKTVLAVTKKVNGGTIGLEDRLNKFNKFYNLLK